MPKPRWWSTATIPLTKTAVAVYVGRPPDHLYPAHAGYGQKSEMLTPEMERSLSYIYKDKVSGSAASWLLAA